MESPQQELTARERAKEARRVELLAAAAKLMGQRGFAGVRLEDIGAAVGVSGPAMYRHFASKDDVLAYMLISISEDLLAGGQRVCDDASDAGSAVDDLIAFHVDFAVSRPDLIRVQDRDLSSLSPSAHRKVRTLQRRYVELWVSVVEQAYGFAPEAARPRVHATIGLINSVPRLPKGDVAALLRTMASAALAAKS